MSIKMVLFDLDGTLLPMDQDVFVNAYFTTLLQKMAPHGYEPKSFLDTMWRGVYAMIKNDGTRTNEEAFWRVFGGVYGERVVEDKPAFEAYYHKEFQGVRSVCGYTPKAVEVLDFLKARGVRVALATNPLFPAVATESRIRWAGLSPEDFELYTTYENSRYCKPNPAYYREVAAALSVRPEECLMVGNDVSDDMVAEGLGMQVFLLTDCLINKDEADLSAWPHGDFEALLSFLDRVI